MRAEGNTRRPLRVVVSGGIGSGKSTVAAMMRDLGAVVIEADRVGHQVLEPEGAAFRDVAMRWPAAVVDGRIDRATLAAVVFSDEEELTALESLTHPHIAAEIRRRVLDAGDRDVVVELPVRVDLVGAGWTWVIVDAPSELRLRRSMQRGMSEQDVANRMNRQPGSEQWLDGAAVVINNNGDIAALERRVRTVWAELEAAATPDPPESG